jgi:hypothetical protein
VKFVETRDVPLPGMPTVGVLYRQTVIFVSIVRRARMVSAGDKEIYTSSGLRGVFVVGVTNWSGEGVGPKSLGMVFYLWEV